MPDVLLHPRKHLFSVVPLENIEGPWSADFLGKKKFTIPPRLAVSPEKIKNEHTRDNKNATPSAAFSRRPEGNRPGE